MQNTLGANKMNEKKKFLWRGWNYMTTALRAALLFATPTFIGGIASLFDLGDTLNNYNFSDTPEEADYKAIHADWLSVGDDIRGAIIEWELENGKK